MDRGEGEELAEFNLLFCWWNTCGTSGPGPMGISSGSQRCASHADPSPAEQDAPVLRLHQRWPLGTEDGEDFRAR